MFLKQLHNFPHSPVCKLAESMCLGNNININAMLLAAYTFTYYKVDNYTSYVAKKCA